MKDSLFVQCTVKNDALNFPIKALASYKLKQQQKHKLNKL